MSINDKEHYDLMIQFEQNYNTERLEREPIELWPKGFVYQDGEVNKLFLAYRMGFAYAKCLYQ